MRRTVIIVGGVAGGASCAARLRRLDEEARIILFERGEYISFANCGLPYSIGGVIPSRDDLLLQTPESFSRRFNIDVRTRSEVIAIERGSRQVEVRDAVSGAVYREGYDKLVLSPGASPLRPPIPGIDHPAILTLWTLPDMDRIGKRLEAGSVARAVIVGGGFIGVEMAENLATRGVAVTIVELSDQVMLPLDFDMAQFVHRHLAEKGVRLMLGDGVRSFADAGGDVRITLKSGRELDANLVILSIGVSPNNALAKECGLALGARGGIVVDETLRTGDPDIYAIGDAVQVVHFVSGEKTMIPLAGPANRMGRMAADILCGLRRTYKGTQGSSVAKVFDMTVAATGLNEKNLKSMGRRIWRDYGVAILHPRSHAGYYPGGSHLALKIVYDRKGRLLGAQGVGRRGVDKRIDVLATVIRMGGTVFDLEELELAYAPPYSSAKDPVNLAGYIAANELEGTAAFITCEELMGLDRSEVTVLDVRTGSEVRAGAIPGSVHIPVDALRERLGELDRERETIVYCAVGVRAHTAARILMQSGFTRVRNLAGGYMSWQTYTGDYTDGE